MGVFELHIAFNREWKAIGIRLGMGQHWDKIEHGMAMAMLSAAERVILHGVGGVVYWTCTLVRRWLVVEGGLDD